MQPVYVSPHKSIQVVLLTFMLFLSSEPSVRRKASLPSVPSTLRKQLVVCPIPDGSTLSHSIALITELFPLLVLQNKHGASSFRSNLAFVYFNRALYLKLA